MHTKSMCTSRQSILCGYFLMITATRLLVQCSPIYSTANQNQQLATNGQSKTVLANILSRNVRNTNSQQTFKPYLMFMNKPPVELTLQVNSKYILECEVNGTPNPKIFWLKNGKIFNQAKEESVEESRYGQLKLSNVKSRLFLDCLTEVDSETTYTCVATTDLEKLYTNTRIVVEQQLPPINKELEYFANQNSIDSAGKDDSVYALESALTGCVSKQSIGSPARIYYWSNSAMEYIGSDSVLHCRATGYPKPSIKWYDSNDQLILNDNHKYLVMANGDLLIRNVTFDDMGKYRCEARNSHGVDSIDKVFFYSTKFSDK